MRVDSIKKALFFLTITVSMFSMIALLMQLYDHWFDLQQAEKNAVSYGQEVMTTATHQIDSLLTGIMTTTKQIAEEVTAGTLRDAALLARLKSTSHAHSDLLGMTAAYEPFVHSRRNRLYAPYYDKRQKKFIRVEELYDYTDATDPDNDWYVQPVQQERALWHEPGFGRAAGTMVMDYGVPFYAIDRQTNARKIAGTITATVSLEGLTQMLNRLDLGKTGYGFILSRSGRLLAYPISEYLRANWTIFKLAQELPSPALAEFGTKMITGETGFLQFDNPASDQISWVFYCPITTTGWSLGVIFIRNEIPYLRTNRSLHRQLIRLALLATLLVFALTILLTRAYDFKLAGVWTSLTLLSIMMAAVIGLMWYLAMSRSSVEHRDESIVVMDRAGLNSFLRSQSERAELHHEALPLFVNTGIFVRSIQFVDAHNVGVSGYIWQRSRPDSESQEICGFTFPGVIPDAEAMDITPAYELRDNDADVRGWHYRVKLRQKFDYAAYPVDRQVLSIALAPPSPASHTILVPDLNAYKLLNITSAPGLLDDIVLPGWRIHGSYFDYQLKNYLTNFGNEHSMIHENVPELNFNIILQRDILTPVIAHVVPLLIVAIMLYGVLVSSTKIESKTSIAGFNTFGVLEICAAFFFVVVLAHIDLRSNLNAGVVTYIEYLYFITYLMFLLSAVNSIMFTTTDQFRVVEYGDNLIAKLLYWPLYLGLTLAITIMIFY